METLFDNAVRLFHVKYFYISFLIEGISQNRWGKEGGVERLFYSWKSCFFKDSVVGKVEYLL